MENALSAAIKENTTPEHQQLEQLVISHLKQIRSDADYAQLLRNFYAYFSAVEAVCVPNISITGLIDLSSRRDSSFIARDITELGGNLDNLPAVVVPEINNLAQAMGAMYVIEGSVLGGPYIVKMLARLGIVNGVSFFSGYGAATGERWKEFVTALNSLSDPLAQQQAIFTAKETFANFQKVF
ncbi:biliverdin-producing heme oxygenase [Pedobacter polaris]|uniref:Biliverdin-producing heme oxygenase n=1 Tax=Pedobacter polaris TaxID=2571273 RepID=A0A4U1CPA2_9SPHI|nr:biliverdin-producing heme oxygenase [Pedobacter polaris]TKC09881.1 biliverdin-producing heme oxygenase [Pedobacter polaris]